MSENNETQRELVAKLIHASNQIELNRNGNGNYFQINVDTLKHISEKLNKDIDETIEILREYFYSQTKIEQ